jgi:hypothetical protein
MLIAVMIHLNLIGIMGYIYKTDKGGQQRLAQGQGSARFHHRYDIDYDIIGYDIDCDIMTMIS